MGNYVKVLVNEYGMFEARLAIDSDLLTKVDIDRALAVLRQAKELSSEEEKVLIVYSLGHTVSSGAAISGFSRWKFRKLLSQACDKITDYLGWEYTDKYILQRNC